MTLTPEEIQIAKSSTYFSEYWGIPGKGLSPEGLIAEYRGAKFIPDEDPTSPLAIYRWEDLRSFDIASQAASDLAKALGFHNVMEYYDAMFKEGEGVLKRFEKPGTEKTTDSSQGKG